MVLGIYCAGGLGKQVLALARYTNSVKGQWEDIVFVDDVVEEDVIQGAAVWRWNDLLDHRDNTEVIIANGEPAHRKTLYEKLKAADIQLGILIHPNADILPDTKIEEGCILTHCFISTECHIGANSFIDAFVSLGHNVSVGECCVINSRAFIAGWNRLENYVYVGPGAFIKDRLTISRWAIIAIGCVVFRNVKECKIVIGNPGKVIGDNSEHRVFGR